VSFDLIQSERGRLAGKMDSQSLLFSFVETSGLEQQVTDGGATDDSVATKPAAAKRDLRCENKETIGVRCKLFYHDFGPRSALVAAIAVD
jgi:hypothetical protein